MSDPIDIDSEGNPLTLSDIIYTNDTIADDLDTKLKSEQLRRYIGELKDPRERTIIILRYGLTDDRPLTQREVAKKLDISRSYVSQRGYCKRRRGSVIYKGLSNPDFREIAARVL